MNKYKCSLVSLAAHRTGVMLSVPGLQAIEARTVVAVYILVQLPDVGAYEAVRAFAF